MISLGLLSILQASFLPGFLFTQFFKKLKSTEIILLSIGLTPVINYLVVVLAVATGVYHRWVVLSLVALEIIILIYLVYPTLFLTINRLPVFSELSVFSQNFFALKSVKGMDKLHLIIRMIIFTTAFASLIYFCLRYATDIKGVFIYWDAVISWDRWASDWYNNNLPRQTWHYPQLIPTNWSLMYQMIGDSSIKFFAKYFMGLIEIFILFSIFITGISKRKIGFFAGVTIAAVLQQWFGSNGSGYVDSPVAFFALLTVLFCRLAADVHEKDQRKYFYLGAILAGGAAATKQAGIWIALVYPILFYVALPASSKKGFFSSRSLVTLLFIYLIVFIVWYIYIEFRIASGMEVSEVQYVTQGIHAGKDYLERLSNAYFLIVRELEASTSIQISNSIFYIHGELSLFVLAGLLFLACKDKFFLWLVLLIILPFTLLWMLFFSYDTRNLALAIPLIGLTSGVGLEVLINAILKILPQDKLYIEINTSKVSSSSIERLSFLKIWYLFIPTILFLVWLPYRFPAETIIDQALSAQREIGQPEVNAELYNYEAINGINGLILTDYQILNFLPEINQYYSFGNPQSAGFIKLSQSSGISYVLISNTARQSVKSYFNKLIEQQKIELIFRVGGYTFMATCHESCDE